MKTKTLLLACAATLLLGGCMDRYIWVKNGSGQAEYEQIKAVCLLEGRDRVPPDNHTEMVSPGTQYNSAGCKGKGCSSYTTYSPPQYDVVDHNAALREQIVRACLFRNGWQEIKLER